MSIDQILRAWRDHDYWLSLSESERARVPDNPAGLVELMDIELDHVSGALHQDTHEYLTCQGASCTCGDTCWGTCNQSSPPSIGFCCC
jgi:mersacidin/lichenicidin family type 2 lantibiotic